VKPCQSITVIHIRISDEHSPQKQPTKATLEAEALLPKVMGQSTTPSGTHTPQQEAPHNQAPTPKKCSSLHPTHLDSITGNQNVRPTSRTLGAPMADAISLPAISALHIRHSEPKTATTKLERATTKRKWEEVGSDESDEGQMRRQKRQSRGALPRPWPVRKDEDKLRDFKM
jgi:hypothetical protein